MSGRTIGGFFPLELPSLRGELPPSDALALSSGRACVRAILALMRPKRLLAPFYICDAALSPARALGIPVVRFAIGRDLLPLLPEPEPDDLALVVDYFGVCAAASARVATLGERAIVDQTHALFGARNTSSWYFTSARKWLGVPDGAFLWGPRPIDPPLPAATPTRPVHLIERRWGPPELAYQAYQDAEAQQDDAVRAMSELSASLLGGVDCARVRAARRDNYQRLQERLARHNQLHLTLGPHDVPFCYPLLPLNAVPRNALRERGLFIPQLWAECATGADEAFAWERQLAESLLPLPIDHRYDAADMDHLADQLEALLEGTS